MAKTTKTRKTRRTRKVKAADMVQRKCKKGVFRHFDQYVKVKTPNGSDSHHAPDEVGEKLAGLPIEEVYEVVAAALVKTKEFANQSAALKSLKAKYAKKSRVEDEDGNMVLRAKNIGLQRMALGNRLRGITKVHAEYA